MRRGERRNRQLLHITVESFYQIQGNTNFDLLSIDCFGGPDFDFPDGLGCGFGLFRFGLVLGSGSGWVGGLGFGLKVLQISNLLCLKVFHDSAAK